MDVYCPKCGEPWDLAELHDIPGMGYMEAWRKFKRIGCAVFGAECGELDEEMAERAKAVYSVLGNDPDGCAAELEDFSF